MDAQKVRLEVDITFPLKGIIDLKATSERLRSREDFVSDSQGLEFRTC